MLLGMFNNEKFIPTVEKLLKSQGLPVKSAYKLKKIAKAIEAELQSFEAAKKEIFDKYGEKSEDGTLKPREDGRVYLDDAQKEEWIKALTDLQSVEVSFGTVTLAELEGVSSLTVEDLVILDAIITE